jgi:two-component system chemotaxis response regulator CheB
MLHERGAYTITQDEDTCVVYGMPKAAVEIGASRLSAPLNSIAWHLFAGLEEASSSKGLRRKAA